ncbi:hypothetical protein HNQ07_000264 [Deinococcus metalli]|uniref:Uncharacterized protein n=1 Tax=Deinococcus metalli TaxID=1141878 RepID=A0A7W8KBE5_9DEIO|nr:hypothetical protein [Deinococcus metalli]MBB5374820.1 hypothetical protein [Deinococcus metalli]GHF33468.1 hypothetical protein GCM10017781_07780 [Deinococcus metalli]
MPIHGVASSPRLLAVLMSCALTVGAHAGAQTTPAATPPAQPAQAPSAATTQAVSAVAVDISAAVRGQIVGCPAALKLSPRAVCLYVKSGASTLRPLIKGRLAARAAGEWKTSGKASTLLVTAKVGDPVNAFVLLSALADQEALVVVDAVQARAAAAPSAPAVPSGVTRGQPYVLGSDLVGVVKVTSLGAGKFRLSVVDQPALTVTVGQRKAQLEGGSVELPLAPATDGKNLIFPVSGLRALGCTVTPAGKDLTVACGTDSVGLKPIVF